MTKLTPCEWGLRSPQDLLTILSRFGDSGAIICGQHNLSLARQLVSWRQARRVVGNWYKITTAGEAELKTKPAATAIAAGEEREQVCNG